MYRLSESAVSEFQDLHESKFGIRPTYDEAQRDLLMLMKLIATTQMQKPFETEVKSAIM